MSLAEFLLYRDIQDLTKMAHVYQCECNRNSKLELVQSIHHKMLSHSFFSQLIQDLHSSFIAYTTYIIFQPTRVFSVEELSAKGQYILSFFPSEDHPRKWISQMLANGWLFPVNAKNQILLEVPLELSSFLRKKWVHYWLEFAPQCKEKVDPHWVKRNEQETIVGDTHIFLNELKKSPIPLTIDGVIHKKVIQTLLQHFSVHEESLKEDKWRFGYGRRFPSYPNRFALIYDYCHFKGWIREEGAQLYLTSAGINQLTNPAINDMLHDMRSYWLKLYRKPIPALPFLSTFLLELTKNVWILEHELYHIMNKWLKVYYYDDEATIFQQRIIQMMVHLGYIQLAIDPSTNLQYIKSCVRENME